jgi:hypothetical protein
MKLNYNYPDGKADCRKPDYDKCDKCEYKKNYYPEEEKCCDEHKFAKCCPKNPCPYPIIFECANGTGAQFEETQNTTTFIPRTIGCLTIDTTCLKNPVVKFDFCSTIEFRVLQDTPTTAKLVFQLCKQCDNGEEICCGNWDWEARFNDTGERLKTSFSFCHCECNSCPGCCTYTVKIVEAQNLGDDVLHVFNTTLQAFAKSGC